MRKEKENVKKKNELEKNAIQRDVLKPCGNILTIPDPTH